MAVNAHDDAPCFSHTHVPFRFLSRNRCTPSGPPWVQPLASAPSSSPAKLPPPPASGAFSTSHLTRHPLHFFFFFTCHCVRAPAKVAREPAGWGRTYDEYVSRASSHVMLPEATKSLHMMSSHLRVSLVQRNEARKIQFLLPHAADCFGSMLFSCWLERTPKDIMLHFFHTMSPMSLMMNTTNKVK